MKKYSIMDLERLGKEIWKDVDIEKYIAALRDEWDEEE